MIIPNGHIAFDTSVAEGVDSNGYPIPAIAEWGKAVECQYLPTTDRQARANNEAMTAKSYIVYVDRLEQLPSERVKLCDMRGDEIGQFSVRSVEHLDAVCQTKITL
jgi:hypothetical protein